VLSGHNGPNERAHTREHTPRRCLNWVPYSVLPRATTPLTGTLEAVSQLLMTGKLPRIPAKHSHRKSIAETPSGHVIGSPEVLLRY